ncbi:2-hydroxyacid dehydrogenase [Candidatus Arthromitus sp. SFB-rat-Yit]|uniref:2-hydroxyacid dehydrogenase n=1 Tax=Candidatus Arthromitus sp. SFB-rat-Yit TaxID=1041504 RepID=UPI000227A475|nr:2-hydroxyacid dehydrogenase [Candidatus Arthromitus sp. SFB-rat-Yit]BAK80952.1 D-lactate dehydrogenase [Candidatus Arthromitus sp. SFB-rat-Yit]
MKLILFDAKPYDKEYFDMYSREYNVDIVYEDKKLTFETCHLANGFDAVCIFVNDVVDKEVIDKLHEFGIKLIVLRCAGYNGVDIKYAKNKITVVRVPAYSPNSIAEISIGMILTLTRKINKAINKTKNYNFSLEGLVGFDLFNRTVGIIGTGKIAQEFMKILSGIGMKILAYDLYPNYELESKLGFKYVDLDTIYKESDIISLHCPLTSDNAHMINKDSISKMKDRVIIVNTARGMLIDTKALIDAIKSGKVYGAALDVYENEKNYFFNDCSETGIDDEMLKELLSLENVILFSHQAYLTEEALTNIALVSLNNIKSFCNNEFLNNEVFYDELQDKIVDFRK